MAAESNRVIFYITSFDDLTPLVDAAQNGYITHVLIGLFHLGYNGPGNTNPYVHINKLEPNDPSYDTLWQTVPTIQGYGVKVMGSLGGGGVGDYGNLFSAYSTFYPMLQQTLETYNLDGLDLDIEESITTANVEQLISDLRTAFKNRTGGFLISAAPVATALTGGGNISGSVDYNQLLSSFDWYNIQFYNGWGDLQNGSSGNPPNYNPNYDGVVNAVGAGNVGQLVAGTPTNPDNANSGYIDLTTLTSIVSGIATSYPGFGGVDGWTYQNALDTGGTVDPEGWAESITNAMASSNAGVETGS